MTRDDLTRLDLRGADQWIRLGRAKWERVKSVMIPANPELAAMGLQEALAAVLTWADENHPRADQKRWTPELWAAEATPEGVAVRKATWLHFKPPTRRTLAVTNPDRDRLRQELDEAGLGVKLRDYDQRRAAGWTHEEAVSIPNGGRRPKRTDEPATGDE